MRWSERPADDFLTGTLRQAVQPFRYRTRVGDLLGKPAAEGEGLRPTPAIPPGAFHYRDAPPVTAPPFRWLDDSVVARGPTHAPTQAVDIPRVRQPLDRLAPQDAAATRPDTATGDTILSANRPGAPAGEIHELGATPNRTTPNRTTRTLDVPQLAEPQARRPADSTTPTASQLGVAETTPSRPAPPATRSSSETADSDGKPSSGRPQPPTLPNDPTIEFGEPSPQMLERVTNHDIGSLRDSTEADPEPSLHPQPSPTSTEFIHTQADGNDPEPFMNASPIPRSPAANREPAHHPLPPAGPAARSADRVRPAPEIATEPPRLMPAARAVIEHPMPTLRQPDRPAASSTVSSHASPGHDVAPGATVGDAGWSDTTASHDVHPRLPPPPTTVVSVRTAPSTVTAGYRARFHLGRLGMRGLR